MTPQRPNRNEARSKIVATIGPACRSADSLAELVQHGVDIFRINAAHGTQADFAEILEMIRQAREITGFQVATLLDLSGPKIRLGQLAQDPLEVAPDQVLTFVRGGQVSQPNQMCSNYEHLVDDVTVGDSIMLA
ncbi:MAG TPA: pyruvate kinase, partial [Planctomycetaceae bacterium]|nr:pyruvate kinase [Planctomycetaceae bacterium]